MTAKMNKQRADNLRLAEDAAEWAMRRLEDRSPECSAKLLQWLKRSPQHIDEFLMAMTTLATLQGSEAGRQLDLEEMVAAARSAGTAGPNVVPLTDEALIAASQIEYATKESLRPATDDGGLRASPRWLRTTALAAGVAALGLGLGLWVLRPFVLDTHSYRTGIGEQRIVRLEDGSLLHLNTRSRIEVDFSARARKLRLLQGEALFTVAHDPSRPFQVLTRSAVVQAVGTQFNVYEHGDSTKISVLEGRVRIAPRVEEVSPAPIAMPGAGREVETPNAGAPGSRSPALLNVGEQADVTRSGEIVIPSTPDVSTAVAWQQRKLVFRAVPLAEVAGEFNRYNESQIRIVGDALSERLIWGVFRADEPQALMKFLGKDPSLKLEWNSKELVVRRREL